jgi:hypothetical protein
MTFPPRRQAGTLRAPESEGTMRGTSLAAAALLLTGAVSAQETPPPNLVPGTGGTRGGPAQMVLAQELFALGLARQDALTVLQAARLAQGVTLTATERLPETTGDAAPAATATAPAAADMLQAAEALVGEDDLLLGLLEDAQASGGQDMPASATRSPGTLAPKARDDWKIAFFGQSYAEVAVAGDGKAPLSLSVLDAGGNSVCIAPVGPFALCGFVPAENGYFTVQVMNSGTETTGYDLLTN